MVAYVGCRKGAVANAGGKGRRRGPRHGKGEKARKWEKDVFFGKRTQPSIANKGLSIFEVHKTNWFLSANEPKSNPKKGPKNHPLCALEPEFACRKAPADGQAPGGYTSFEFDVTNTLLRR